MQDILSFNSIIHQDKTALISNGERLNYSEIDSKSNQLANALLKYGLKSGERIIFYLKNSSELVISIFAALKANLIFSVVDHASNFLTLTKIIRDCQASAIISYAHHSEDLQKLSLEFDFLSTIILTGQIKGEAIRNAISFEEIFDDESSAIQSSGNQNSSIAYLIYTSGSTVEPKGVIATHKDVIFTIENGLRRIGQKESDIHVSPLPLSFSPGINQLFQTFRAAGTLILEQSFTFPVSTLKKMEAEKATGFAGVPTVLLYLLKNNPQKYDLSSLRYITSIGAALPVRLIEEIMLKFPGISLYSMYGSAEASFTLCLDPSQISVRPTSVGKPFPGVYVQILDENGNNVPEGETGELVISGGNVRSGYWSGGALDNAIQKFRDFNGGRSYYTGDLFRKDADGYYYFVGRTDDMIKTGAKKVILSEIESALNQLEGVLECAVAAIPDDTLGMAIKAFIVPDNNQNLTLDQNTVLSFCRLRLEPLKIPKEIEFTVSLPKTVSGKIQRKKLV